MILFLLLGPPGSGKGSLSQKLVEEYDFFHFSTGKLFRNLKNQHISKGDLVPDDVVNNLIFEELKKLEKENKKKYIILDGFPRTIEQAKFLEKNFLIKKAFLISNILEDVLIKRLSSRLLCEENDHSFNLITSPPAVPGICDFDGSKLYRRNDDESETIKKRLDIYYKFTDLLSDFYEEQQLLERLNFQDDIKTQVYKISKYI